MSNQEREFNYFNRFDHDGNLTLPDYSVLREIDTHLFESELNGFKERQREYFEAIKSATTITIVVGCDDGRIGVSGLLDKNGDLKIYYPKIGGGVPNRDSLRILMALIDKIRNLDGVGTFTAEMATQVAIEVLDNQKIEIALDYFNLWLTQHGDANEINKTLTQEQCNHASCGLRAVVGSFDKTDEAGKTSNELKEIGDLIRQNNFASLDELESASQGDANDKKEIASQILRRIETIHEKTKFPRRLIFIASRDNFSANFSENAQAIHRKVNSYAIIDP